MCCIFPSIETSLAIRVLPETYPRGSGPEDLAAPEICVHRAPRETPRKALSSSPPPAPAVRIGVPGVPLRCRNEKAVYGRGHGFIKEKRVEGG